MSSTFDLESLAWIKAPLDEALQATRSILSDWNGVAPANLKQAAAHLHRVHGALHIVELPGLRLLAAEIGRLFIQMGERTELRVPGKATALRAIDALQSYLDGLMNGAAHIEMQLTPIFQEVVVLRGGAAPQPCELFYPDLRLCPPRHPSPAPLNEADRGQALRRARAQYQKGLVQFLRDRDTAAGLMQMDQSVRLIADIAPLQEYSFWWSAAGFMEGLRGKACDAARRRLCGRIDLQIRDLQIRELQTRDLQVRRPMESPERETAGTVPHERVFRELLYRIAQDGAPDGRAAEVREFFGLDRYLAQVAIAPLGESHLAELRESLIHAQEHWMRYCSGRAESLASFQEATLSLFEYCARLPALQTLTRIIQAVAKHLPDTQNEALQLEMATALLLTQNAAAHPTLLGAEFQRQSDAQAMRLQAAIDPDFDPSSLPRVDLLDEYAHAAEEKLILAQVTSEIQANLDLAEEMLEPYFRDSNQRTALPVVPALLQQITGALNLLQLEVAASLVRETVHRVTRLSEAPAPCVQEDIDWVAEAMSYLGLYLEALRSGRDDSKALQSLLDRPMSTPLTPDQPA